MAEKEPLTLKKRMKKKKLILIIVIAAILVIAGIVTAALVMSNDTAEEKETVIMTSKPFISTIELTVSGSGTVEPMDRYEIVSLVSGDIISSPFEEGDLVDEDDIVYVIDHETQDKNIESAKNSLTKSKIRNKIYLDEEEFNKTLAKYTVRAEEDGIISDFSLEVDDKVTANGKLGTIQNFDEIIATVPFNAAQFEKIAEGDRATVYLYPSMYTAEGTVTYKSYKTTGSIGGAVVYDVEITFDGSNLTLTDTGASATVHTALGDVDAPASGTLGYDEPVNIFAEVTGDVLSVPDNIKNGAKVKKGDILFVIDSEDFLEEKTLIEFEYHDLELSLESAQDRLDDYEIKAPISGTVITKNAKKGDTVSAGNNTSALMVIADMSAMKFIFQADETDIEKIKVGLVVKVTAEAVTNKVFSGVVESVATEGVSANGVSYYDVEVVVSDYGQNDESGMLRSGMNVSAEIVYEKTENAMCLPVSAVTSMGGESYVFVKNAKAVNAEDSGEETDETENGGMAESGKMGFGSGDKNNFIKERIDEMTPEGFTAVKVVTGVTNGLTIEIISGIDQSAEVYLAENDNVQSPITFGGPMGFTGGMGGGMYGGGMYGGGMYGGGMGGSRR